MENEQSTTSNPLPIDSSQLLERFIRICEHTPDYNPFKCLVSSSMNILIIVHYFRKYKDVNEFINKYFNYDQDYFHLQWVRAMWNKLSKMSESEISELVINQITLVANSEEEQ